MSIFVNRDKLVDERKKPRKGFIVLVIILTICIVSFFMCSCKTYHTLPVDEVMFDINNVVEYDSDRNICTYQMVNVYVYDNEFHTVCDTVELSLESVLFEELEQGTSAYISNGRVLYD